MNLDIHNGIITFSSSNLIFKECSAMYGGGMSVQHHGSNNNLKFISPEKILFDNCSSSYRGGGLHCYMNAANAKISYSKITFYNCRASNGGGAYI
jgi:hypothetical protein